MTLLLPYSPAEMYEAISNHLARAHAPELVKELVAYSTKVIIAQLIIRITADCVAICTGCGGA